MSSVDVIVPCYRYGHFLQECVESILAENVYKVRVLIIDDASPDNTAEVAANLVRKDPRVTFIRHITNQKHIATYNEGIEWVTADYMLLLSADDYLLPGALSRALKLLDSYPEVGFVYGQVIRSAESGIKGPPHFLSNIEHDTEHQVYSGIEFIKHIADVGTVNIVPTPTAVVRTELQKRLGGYLAELPHTGDMEMWLRLAAHASVVRIDQFQAVYRQHGNNMQRAYYTNKQLPDLLQREAAVRCFYKTCKALLPDPEEMLSSLFRPLSLEAVNHASAAFNDDEMELSEQLSGFAAGIYPQVKRSVQWKKLAFKRRLGSKFWRGLRQMKKWIRRKKTPVES